VVVVVVVPVVEVRSASTGQCRSFKVFRVEPEFYSM